MKRFYKKYEHVFVVLQFIAILEAFARLENHNDFKGIIVVSPIIIYWIVKVLKENA